MGWRADLTRDLFRVYETEGASAFFDRVPEDVVWTPMVPGRSFVGREFMEFLQEEGRRGEAREHQVLEIDELGEHHVLVSGALQVRSRDLHVDVQPCWLFRFADRRLCAMTSYPTRGAALAAFDALPPQER